MRSNYQTARHRHRHFVFVVSVALLAWPVKKEREGARKIERGRDKERGRDREIERKATMQAQWQQSHRHSH